MRFAVLLAAVAAFFVQAGEARAVTWVIQISGPVTGVTYSYDPHCGQPICNEVVTPFRGSANFTVEVSPFVGAYTFNRTIGARRFADATLHFDGYSITGSDLHFYEELYSCTGSNSCVRNSASASTFAVNIVSGSPAPEPATWVMLITGFATVGAAMRHRPRLTSLNLRFNAPSLPPRSKLPKREGSPAAAR